MGLYGAHCAHVAGSYHGSNYVLPYAADGASHHCVGWEPPRRLRARTPVYWACEPLVSATTLSSTKSRLSRILLQGAACGTSSSSQLRQLLDLRQLAAARIMSP